MSRLDGAATVRMSYRPGRPHRPNLEYSALGADISLDGVGRPSTVRSPSVHYRPATVRKLPSVTRRVAANSRYLPCRAAFSPLHSWGMGGRKRTVMPTVRRALLNPLPAPSVRHRPHRPEFRFPTPSTEIFTFRPHRPTPSAPLGWMDGRCVSFRYTVRPSGAVRDTRAKPPTQFLQLRKAKQ